MSTTWQISLPGYQGEGPSLLAAAGGSWRVLCRALTVNLRSWWFNLPVFDRRRLDEGPPGGEDRRTTGG